MSHDGSRPPALRRQLPKSRNVFAVWLGLPFITFGIYTLVWYYKVNKETLFSPRNKVDPLVALLIFVLGGFLIIPPFLTIYRTGNRIREVQQVAGLRPSCRPWLGIVLVFLFGLWTAYYQDEMNKVVNAYPGERAGAHVGLRDYAWTS